jgi:hypothetical protein
MTTFDIRTMLDPVKTAREEGRQIGRREMRDQIREIFATHAATHPNPEIRAELWPFINYIERMHTT